MSVIQIPRDPQNIQANIDTLNNLKAKFVVQHGTYTTTIITDNKKVRYMMNSYHNRVFMCASLIKRDVLNSELAKQIMASEYVKMNFGFSKNPKSYNCKRVLNIDITSAYATCLLRNGLITEETYKILKSLPKTERLPCVGMLATSYTKFFYENGECVNVEMYRSPTANVFFFLIDEINAIMKSIEFYLGSKFIFYWVDGIFFDFNTDKNIIKEIEQFLTHHGYDYKYENVDDFNVTSDNENMVIQMIKNGESKEYTIGHDNVGESIKKYLNDKIKKQNNLPNTRKI
jgi:hypothetical protein